MRVAFQWLRPKPSGWKKMTLPVGRVVSYAAAGVSAIISAAAPNSKPNFFIETLLVSQRVPTILSDANSIALQFLTRGVEERVIDALNPH
jgi:hypothetical protein